MKKVVSVLVLMTLMVCATVSCSGSNNGKGAEPEMTQQSETSLLTNEEKPAFVLKGVKNLTRVAQLTGKESVNKTEKYGVSGTDLGSMIEMDDMIYMAFGDTFGPRSDTQEGAGGDNWRSNVMAVISDKDPSDGLKFDTMISDKSGIAKELLESAKIDNDEMTVIPTGGFSANGNLYLNFMSVKHWGDPGKWDANYGGLAVSRDEGKTWTRLDKMQWPGDSNFIQVAAYDAGEDIYFWCIPSGRFGGVKFMKVNKTEVEDMDKYAYFKGEKGGKAEWSSGMQDSREIVPAPVGELSVIWNKYLGRWIMTYLNEESRAIEIREGVEPWGPWSDPVTLVSANDYPALYGAFMHPRYMEQDGKVIYFAMSQWIPYNVFWMRAELEK